MFAPQILTNQASLNSRSVSVEYGGMKNFKKCSSSPKNNIELSTIYIVFFFLFFRIKYKPKKMPIEIKIDTKYQILNICISIFSSRLVYNKYKIKSIKIKISQNN